MGKTKIEWCSTLLPDGTLLPGYTFNPWWGCVKRSEGCQFCYAQRDSNRWGHDVFGADKPRRFFGVKHWNNPIRWDMKAVREGIRRKVFSGSMCDILEDRRDLDEHRARLWELIKDTQHLDWLLLTKRIENAPLLMGSLLDNWPKNARLGVTAENQERANHQIHKLLNLRVPNFISVEPMLGRIDLAEAIIPSEKTSFSFDHLAGFQTRYDVGWCIIGGESGTFARHFPIEGAIELIRQCKYVGIPVFVKQMGAEWARERGLRGKGDDDRYWPGALRVKEFPND